MSRERHLLDTLGAVCGWTLATKYELLLGYVENQNSPDALEDFLKEAAYEELVDSPSYEILQREGV